MTTSDTEYASGLRDGISNAVATGVAQNVVTAPPFPELTTQQFNLPNPSNVVDPTLLSVITAFQNNINALRTDLVVANTLTVNGHIYATGDIYSAYSDENLKDIVGNIDNAIDIVNDLDVFYYKPNELAKSLGIDTTDEVKVGVGASSVKRNLPMLVKPIVGHEDFNTVIYDRLVVVLIAAIQQQQKQINLLKEKLK